MLSVCAGGDTPGLYFTQCFSCYSRAQTHCLLCTCTALITNPVSGSHFRRILFLQFFFSGKHLVWVFRITGTCLDGTFVVQKVLGDSHANSYIVFMWRPAATLTLTISFVAEKWISRVSQQGLPYTNFRTLKRVRCLCWECCSGTLANCNWRQSCGIKLSGVVWITDLTLTNLALKEHSMKCAQALFEY